MISSRMFALKGDTDIKTTEDSTAIFLIDFDGTIASGHTHNALQRAIGTKHIKDDKESHWQFLRDSILGGKHYPLGSTEEWRKVFTTLLSDGHKVAIISFSSFPHTIANYIREILGLSEDQIKQIYIYAKLPSDPARANKNSHIQNAIQHFKHNGDMSKVVLIDDSITNIVGASNLGCITITVDNSNSHLAQIIALSAKLKEKPETTHNQKNDGIK